MPHQVKISVRCHWCSKHKPASEVLTLSSNQIMCLKCHEWHAHALQVLSGGVPRGCQECGMSLDDLNALTNSATTRMYVVPKDGIYQVLCLPCKESYCQKRADLYRNTKFGQEMKRG